MSKQKKSHKKALIVWIVLLALLLAVLVAYAVYDTVTVDYKPAITIEAGANMPKAEDFFTDYERYEAYKAQLLVEPGVDSTFPGTFDAYLQIGSMTYNACLVVQDTVAPTATTKDLTVYNVTSLKPEDFIDTVTDVTDVTVTFAAAPTDTAGKQTVTLLLTDLGDNKTTVTAQLTKLVDPNYPVISGVPRILETYEGGTISYRQGVTVTDQEDPDIKLEIDSSGVNLAVPGTYTVIYSATDKAGNTTKVEATVCVYEKSAGYVELDEIYAMADELLATFIDDSMTTLEKVEAVYRWVRGHNQYAGSTDKSDWLQGAYTQMTTRKGDCFGFFALNKLFLQRLDIPTIDVRKVKNYPGDTNHWWLLVSIDGGENYYHFDNVWRKDVFLFTDAQLDAYSKRIFNRDKSLYPATPTTPYDQ